MIIAIDTGGTKTLLASFSNSGEQLKSFEFKTPKNPVQYLDIVHKIIKNEFKKNTIQAISIAVAGICSNKEVLWANNLGWQNFKIVDNLQEKIKNIPIFLENDANLAGYYEAKQTNNSNVLYITISTGIGSGIIIDGQISKALSKSEIGRIAIEYDGRIREWETFASGKAIYEIFGKYAKDIKRPKYWLNIADRISRGLLVTIPLLQPETIIIGGSIGEQFESFNIFLHQLLVDNLPSHIVCPNIIKATKPKECVIYGCYEYAKAKLTN